VVHEDTPEEEKYQKRTVHHDMEFHLNQQWLREEDPSYPHRCGHRLTLFRLPKVLEMMQKLKNEPPQITIKSEVQD
jgi:hypothetical protein